MAFEVRGELDPVPTKRVSTAAEVETSLTGKTHVVVIDNFTISMVLADASSSAHSVEGAALAGSITVTTTISTKAEIDAAATAMMTGTTRFSDAIRSAKPSVGLVGQPPIFISFAVREDGGQWGSYNYWPPLRPWYVYDTIKAIEVEKALQQDVSLVDRLLAQATYWAVHADGNDPYSAVLLAAIACESHAKSMFHGALTARGEGPLGDLLLSNTLSSRALELYGPIAMAVVGHHLKTDHPALYKRVERLFQLRNKVAHTGTFGAVEPKEDAFTSALTAVLAARQATSWLNDVVASNPLPKAP